MGLLAKIVKGCLAQLVEHISRKDGVVSSSLTVASKKKIKKDLEIKNIFYIFAMLR